MSKTEKKTDMRVARGVNSANMSVMPIYTRKLIRDSHRFSGERFSRVSKGFVHAANTSHTRAVNRSYKRRVAAPAGMGHAFPSLVRQ